LTLSSIPLDATSSQLKFKKFICYSCQLFVINIWVFFPYLKKLFPREPLLHQRLCRAPPPHAHLAAAPS